MQRDSFKCRSCGSDDKTLHVHHIKYVSSDPWDHPDKILVTLCEKCHEQEENYKKNNDVLKTLSEHFDMLICDFIDYIIVIGYLKYADRSEFIEMNGKLKSILKDESVSIYDCLING